MWLRGKWAALGVAMVIAGWLTPVQLRSQDGLHGGPRHAGGASQVTAVVPLERYPFSGEVVQAAAAPPSGAAANQGQAGVSTSPPSSADEPVFKRYLAEGATSTFFDTRIAILNPTQTATTATLTFLTGTGTSILHTVEVPALTRVTIEPKTIPGLENAEFSTVVEADQPLVVDRTMTWDATGYGAHAETAVEAPSPIWYLAEGATHSGFDLFYLIQNPSLTETAVRVRYLLTSGMPLVKEYILPPSSRTNIWVNLEEFPGLGRALASAEFSAVVEAIDGTPIIVERAMYLSSPERPFNAGHESMGVTAPSTQWFLAEGATGPFFDLFVLIANPGESDAAVTVTYLLGDGTTYTRGLTAPANSRSNIWVNQEQFAGIPGLPLAEVAVSTTVESTNDIPIIVERAMWWPRGGAGWYEAHNSAGSTVTGTRWALAEGEDGGPHDTETYILIANASPYTGSATVTLLFEDGTSAVSTYALLAQSRTNVPVRADFPGAAGRRFGAIVESGDATPVPIVVERAMYRSVSHQVWAAGTNALATVLPIGQEAPTAHVQFEFRAEPAYVPVNTASTVMVTLDTSKATTPVTVAELFRVDEAGAVVDVVGAMHDDGLNGDGVAGDGLFSRAITIHRETRGSEHYRASVQIGGETEPRNTEPVTVHIWTELRHANAPRPLLVPFDADHSNVRAERQNAEWELIRIEVLDPRSLTYETAFTLLKATKAPGVSLIEWFDAVIDREGVLTANKTYSYRETGSGRQALIMEGGTPGAFERHDMELPDACVMSRDGQHVWLVTSAHDSPLSELGFSYDEIRALVRQVVTSLDDQ